MLCNLAGRTYADVPNHLPITVAGPGARAAAEHPLDVICCVKRYASDNSCSQAPMLAIPCERFHNIPEAVPTSLRVHNTPSDALLKDWLELAEYLLNTWAHDANMLRAAQYLYDLTTNGHLAIDDRDSLPFHCSRPRAALLTLQALESGSNAASYLMPVATMKWHIKRLPVVAP